MPANVGDGCQRQRAGPTTRNVLSQGVEARPISQAVGGQIRPHAAMEQANGSDWADDESLAS